MTLAYIVRRLFFSLFTLWAVVTLTFLLFRLIPADPAAMMIDPLTDPGRAEILRERFGLNEPLIVQYFRYFGLIFSGDLGTSYVTRQPVTATLTPAFAHSLVLATAILAIAYIIGCTLGALMGWKRDSRLDRYGMTLALLLRGVPPFLVGLIFIMFFAIWRAWLPASGMRSSFESSSLLSQYASWDFVRHLTLPAITGAIYVGTTPLLVMRSVMLDVSQAPYLELAVAKGASPRRVFFSHALRNAVVPLVSMASQFFAFAVGGLITIEVIFSWPGLGREIVNSLLNRDYPIAQGAFLYIGALVVCIFLVSDIVVAALDPRARRVAATV